MANVKITRELLLSSTVNISGSEITYLSALRDNAGLELGIVIEAAEAVELFGASTASLFSDVVSEGDEVYLTTPEGREICVAEFELFIIAVTGSNGFYNSDYTVFALDEIEE